MRHATRTQRLSLPSDHRQALVGNLVKSLVRHGQLQTTHARAKEAQRLADRLISLGKEGSLHSRRLAFRILQDRTLVKRLFGEIAPRFVDVNGGFTRVTRLGIRRGDGASLALLAWSRLPAVQPSAPVAGRPTPKAPPAPSRPAEAPKKPRRLLESLRDLWTRKKKGGSSS